MEQLSHSLEQLPKPAALLPAFQPAHVGLTPSGNWSVPCATIYQSLLRFGQIDDGVLSH